MDIGYKSTRFVPYYMGYKLSHAVMSELLAGREVQKFKDINILIEPNRLNRKVMPSSLSKLIISTIEYCDEEIQEDLYSNIILTGQVAKDMALAKSLGKDMKNKRPNKTILIFTPPNEYYNWYCASQIALQKNADLGKFQFVSQRDFNNNPDIIYYPRIYINEQ